MNSIDLMNFNTDAFYDDLHKLDLCYNADILKEIKSEKYFPDNFNNKKFSKIKITTGHYIYDREEIGFNISFIAYNDNDDKGKSWNLLYNVEKDIGMVDNINSRVINKMDLCASEHYNLKLQTDAYLIDFMKSMTSYYNNKRFSLNTD